MDVPRYQYEKYFVFKLSFASALKENNIINYIYLEIFFNGNLYYNTFNIEQEVCNTDYCRNKKCSTEKVITPLDYTENQKNWMMCEACYELFDTLLENAEFMGDNTIQLYLSIGNAIFSDDGENAVYIG